MLDKASEKAKGANKIGSTLKGIGPTYVDKTGRNGLRVGDILAADFDDRCEKLQKFHLNCLRVYDDVDISVSEYVLNEKSKLWFDAIEFLRGLNICIDSEYYLNDALFQGKRILAEGAQGTMLDIDFGTYPFVTSSNTITAGACNGLGIPPTKIKEVIGIAKAYCTRVGSGPFPSELFDADGERIRTIGKEFGATTGRPRRTGWIDIPQLLYAIMINGVTQLALTKSDVLNDFEKIKVCNQYQTGDLKHTNVPFDLCDTNIKPVLLSSEGWMGQLNCSLDYADLPLNFRSYVSFLEGRLKTPITMISTGPEREQLLVRSH